MSVDIWRRIKAAWFAICLAVAETRHVDQNVRVNTSPNLWSRASASSSTGMEASTVDPHRQDQARFIFQQILADPNFENQVSHVAEQIGALKANQNFQKHTKLVAEQVESMIVDPAFQKHAKLVAEQMEAMDADPNSQEQAKLTAYQVETLMADPSVKKRAKLLAEQMQVMMADQYLQEQAALVAELVESMETSPAKGAQDRFIDNVVDRLFDWGFKAVHQKGVAHVGSIRTLQAAAQPRRVFSSTTAVRWPSDVAPFAANRQPTQAEQKIMTDATINEQLTQPEGTVDQETSAFNEYFSPATLMLGLAMLQVFQPEAALAKGGEYGIWEGRLVSLAHPAVMALMYGASAYAGFTGFQWRQLRESGTEITRLKSELKTLQAKNLTQEAATLSTKIDEMSETRKALTKSDLRTKHYQVGSLILGLGTAFAIEGPVNTYLRAQKLFPGPHLYAGAGLVVAWALAASLVPPMQKGQDWARNSHIALNVLALGLFTWQIPTGFQITMKVIANTKFP